MNALRRFLEFAWPELVLDGTSWVDEWRSTEKEKFIRVAKIFFVLAALGYIGHYFYFDIPNNLKPLSAWLAFRIASAACCVACLIFYSSKFANVKYYRLPAAITIGIGCIAQSFVTLFYPEAPWIYPFAFTLGGVLVLQMSPLKSMFFALPVSLACFPQLLAAGVDIYSLISATFFFALVAAVTRSSYSFEIQAFLREHERDESRREIISLGKDYEGRLKSFIPRVISQRIETRIDNRRMSPLEATIEVLNPTKQNVACLFSDIRGFTQGSKDMDNFLKESVLPEVKACSDAVENHYGIPRKIGDLIFAYFDDRDPMTNMLRATLAGIELSELNEAMNVSTTAVEVTRYILISSGEAIVGNVGGLNSGVEITALGPPVNFLSRLDDATKEPGLARHLKPGDIILSAESASLLCSSDLDLSLYRVQLDKENVSIRDFPEVDSVFILRPSEEIRNYVSEVYSKVCDRPKLYLAQS